MTVKKLTDADRKEILKLYRQTGETTSTLAERYGVSNSTISRFLKVTLPEQEYETLIAAKRAARTSGGEETPKPLVTEPEPEVAIAQHVVESPPKLETTAQTTPTPTPIRRVSPATTQLETANVEAGRTNMSTDIQDISSSLPPPSLETPRAMVDSTEDPLDVDVTAQASTVAQMLHEELLDESEELDDEDDDDLDDDDDIYDEDDDDLDEPLPILKRRLPVGTLIQVLPLSEASLPRTCYLVIDRAAELITRPLREFGDLGQIPSQEFQQRTLPVFDNHRIARRFSNKRDRVIKVPDSRILQKTRSHLQAKGITRLLFDGRVYSLSSN